MYTGDKEKELKILQAYSWLHLSAWHKQQQAIRK
jgi:hypothetical protein